MLLGAHLSIAGGLCEALRAARRYRFPTLALFLRNQRQWAAAPLTDKSAGEFRALRSKLGIGPVAAHGSYLLNLAGSEAVRSKSILALAEDLRRCERLGIEYLVIHPGSCAEADEGVRRIAEGLREALAAAPEAATMVLLETTSGAGHSIGGRFEELAAILAQVREKGSGAEKGTCCFSSGWKSSMSPFPLGVCLDTCHVFAAGYDVRTPEAWAETAARFDKMIGLSRLKVVHLNDSVGELGSRLDRHAHIGKGRIGLAGFAAVVRDARLAGVPLILETPKGKDGRGRDWDRVNAGAIRRLARSQASPLTSRL
jgi:deoxyribonuclease IV